MKKLMVAVVAIAGMIGCFEIKQNGIHGDDEPVEARTNAPATYLCVGMEFSSRFGSCPGCALDARNMAYLFSKEYGYSGKVLISGEATKYAVVKALMEGVMATPEDGMFIFCYSGHGGQEYLGGYEPGEADKPDEYLCLYDSYLLDDAIWDILSRCKGRVFMYFDACHSATMYRSVSSELKVGGLTPENGAASMYVQPDGSIAMAMSAELVSSKGFTFNIPDLTSARAMSADAATTPRVMCWSGCKEVEYSYGGATGGVMTRSLLVRWRKGMKYGELWESVVNGVQAAQPTQHPVMTIIGDGFSTDMEAFK